MLVVMLLGVALLLVLYWERVWAASVVWKAVLAFAAVVVLPWPWLIFSRHFCDIARAATCARCCKCGGPAAFDADPDGGISDRPVTYTCRKCGFQEHLKSFYSDEVPKNDGCGAGSDGLGGGGG